MKYKGKERRVSKRTQKKINEFLDIEEWNQFYEDRVFGGEIFDEVKHIEDDMFGKNRRITEI